jgi:hypothetical protein
MKCEICRNKVEEIFLNKVLGTYIKDAKGKRHLVCKQCQKQYSKEEILSKL